MTASGPDTNESNFKFKNGPFFSEAERLFLLLFICMYSWSVNTNIDAHLKENLNFVWKEIQ